MSETRNTQERTQPTGAQPVPLLDLQAQFAAIEGEVRAAMDRALASQYFILGPEVVALEAEIAAYSQCAVGIGVSSGTDALLVALMALDIGPGDEVITTAYSFFATAGCISRLGARPVFVDIDPPTYNIDPRQIEQAITPPHQSHLAGTPFRPVCRHGCDSGNRRTVQPEHHRRRGPGHRR